MSRSLRQDSGFSLSELMVVLGLMGVVLAASYAGMYALTKGADTIANQASAAHDFADPLEQMSKVIMQNSSIQNAIASTDDARLPINTDYCLEAWTDRNDDGNPELNAFYVDAQGELVWDTWVYAANRTTKLSFKRWVMSINNANVSANTPLFMYYDSLGNAVTDSTKRPSDTRSIKISVRVQQTGGNSVTDSRNVTFRNGS